MDVKVNAELFLKMIWKKAIQQVNIRKPQGKTIREKIEFLSNELQNAIWKLEEIHNRKTHKQIILETLLYALMEFSNSITEVK